MGIVTSSQIYWLTRCDGIRGVLGWNACFAALCAVSTIFLIVLTIITLAGIDDIPDASLRSVKRSRNTFEWISAVLLLVCSIGEAVKAFVPTTREMAAILVVPRIANAQSVQDIGSEIVTLAKEWLTELRPKKPDDGVSRDQNTVK